VIPTWDTQEKKPIVSIIAKQPFLCCRIQSIQYEGLGVEHEQWLASKTEWGCTPLPQKSEIVIADNANKRNLSNILHQYSENVDQLIDNHCRQLI
jgi:hypothetical protein